MWWLLVVVAASVAFAQTLVGNLRVDVAAAREQDDGDEYVMLGGQVPEKLIRPTEELLTIDTAAGKDLFAKLLTGKHSSYVLPLLANLETQMNLGACAPASACTVLNTFKFNQPYDPTYTMFSDMGFAHWTQDAFIFSQCEKQVVGARVFGQILQDFGKVLKCIGLNVDCHHGNSTMAHFDSVLVKHLETDGHVVVANFQRSLLHQDAGGHFSPLGGMVKNKILVLDVARYKYKPVFVSKTDMLRAMMTLDSQSMTSRGFCAVWK